MLRQSKACRREVGGAKRKKIEYTPKGGVIGT